MGHAEVQVTASASRSVQIAMQGLTPCHILLIPVLHMTKPCFCYCAQNPLTALPPPCLTTPPSCFHHASTMPPSCLHHASPCLYHASTMTPPCLHHVSITPPPCLHHASTMPPPCTHHTSPCLHHAFIMLLPCLHYASTMHPPCLHHASIMPFGRGRAQGKAGMNYGCLL